MPRKEGGYVIDSPGGEGGGGFADSFAALSERFRLICTSKVDDTANAEVASAAMMAMIT